MPRIDGTDVSVVICAYTLRRWHDLSTAVRSVIEQEPRPREVIVVVDHNDALRERLKASELAVRIVPNGFPTGLSGARNAGVAASDGTIVAFLDDDARARPGWLAALLGAYADDHGHAVRGRGGVPSERHSDGIVALIVFLFMGGITPMRYFAGKWAARGSTHEARKCEMMRSARVRRTHPGAVHPSRSAEGQQRGRVGEGRPGRRSSRRASAGGRSRRPWPPPTATRSVSRMPTGSTRSAPTEPMSASAPVSTSASARRSPALSCKWRWPPCCGAYRS